MNKKKIKEKGITLIALVITIIVLLILAGIGIVSLTGDNGILEQTQKADEETLTGKEIEQVKVAYSAAEIKRLGEEVNASDLQEELDKTVSAEVTYNSDGTLNVLFTETKRNYNVNKGNVIKTEIDETVAMFDTGINVAIKIRTLVTEGNIDFVGTPINVSIDGIKRYSGTPDLSTMTEDNIVSWTEGYTEYEQNPEAYSNMISEGTELCPIYMWFEENEETNIRDIFGNHNITSTDELTKEVQTGTLYWWSESNNVYLNPDSSSMFAGLPYLEDISGLKNIRTNYVTKINSMFSNTTNQSLTNVDALENWDTSNITDMSNLFVNCIMLSDINGLKNWNTSNVKNMSSLFEANDSYNIQLSDISPLSNWDVSKVTDMSHMFFRCNMVDLTALSNWNVSNVENMQQMFYGCDKLTDASAINNWDITKVSDFTWMFYEVAVYPEFTRVPGTWNGEGTFTPD